MEKLLKEARNVPIYVSGLSIPGIPQAPYIYICLCLFTVLEKLNLLDNALLCSHWRCSSGALIKQADQVISE